MYLQGAQGWCPRCYWGCFIFNTGEWSGKRLHYFCCSDFVRFEKHLCLVPRLYWLAPLSACIFIPVFSSCLLNTTEPSWIGRFREQSAQAVYRKPAIPGSWSQRSLYWGTNLDGLDLMGGQWNVAWGQVWINWDTWMLKNWFGINLGDILLASLG